MDLWILLRALKFLGIAALAAGLHGATGSRHQAERLDAALGLAPLGLALTWLAGFGLMKATGGSLGDLPVLMALLGSFNAVHLAQLAARAETRRPGLEVLAWSGFGFAMGVMVGRDLGTAMWAVGGISSAIAAIAAAARGAGAALVPDPDARRRTLTWFWRIARAEGVSAIALLAVYMPLKRGFGIVLDGGSGWFGWVHGVLTLLFLGALPTAARAGGWTARRVVEAFVAGLFPFGTFVFEARVRRADGPEVADRAPV